MVRIALGQRLQLASSLVAAVGTSANIRSLEGILAHKHFPSPRIQMRVRNELKQWIAACDRNPEDTPCPVVDQLSRHESEFV